MPQPGKGQRQPGSGRPKGSPNRVTREARARFADVFARLLPDVEGWIRAAAARDPAEGAGLFLRMAEYHVPRLARQEITGEGGGPLTVTIRKGWSDAALTDSQRAPLVLLPPAIPDGVTPGEAPPVAE